MKTYFQQLTFENIDYVVECYHYLHAHPELSFQEFETARFVCDELGKSGISFVQG